MRIQKRKILKYAVLPGILPRIHHLLTSGFVYVAYLIAVIFNTARLIPDGHPYMNVQNMGRYGIRHVIAEAANHLEFKTRNIDQIAIFTIILAGIVILMLQFAMIIFAFMTHPVYASPYEWAGGDFFDWFVLDGGSAFYPFTEDQDIALGILDTIFGVEGIFNSCVSTAVACVNHRGEPITEPGAYPFPIHLALHQLFNYYSIGISVIALMVIIYLVTTIIGETAASGTPFGRRFNKAWAPVRLMMFFALLAPLNIGGQNAGLNGAQLITLWTAKFGSNFASNAWGIFNETTAREYFPAEELVAIPNLPDLGNLSQFWSVVHACVYGEAKRNRDVQMYIVRDSDSPSYGGNQRNAVTHSIAGMPSAILGFTDNAPVTIRIGVHDPVLYPDQTGNVFPYCGELSIPISTFVDMSGGIGAEDPTHEGAYSIFRSYWQMIRGFMSGFGVGPTGFANEIASIGHCFVDRIYPVDQQACIVGGDFQQVAADHMDNLNTYLATVINDAVQAQRLQIMSGNYLNVEDELVQRGWAAAAIWYNWLAQMNGEMASAAFAVPKVEQWPKVMEDVHVLQMQHSESVHGAQRFSLFLPDGSRIRLSEPGDEYLAAAYHRTYMFWEDVGVTPNMEGREPIGNPFLDVINGVFGTTGLFNLRHPPSGGVPGNLEVHPLATLSALGKTMVEAAIVNFGVAVGGTIGSGLLGVLGNFSASQAALGAATGFATSVAKIIILIGAMLFYVLPFLPFIYFFFALSGWVKSIFEAMVAMPLWALAHLRIDGEGLPGPGASNGYYLLLEIFVRPILILAGLLGSILITSALVSALNMVFDTVVVNVGGHDSVTPDPTTIEYYRGPIDEFFYTLIYAIMVYMICTASFKLIDSVPNNVLRWIGVSVSTIQENAGDPASTLSSGIYQKSQLTLNQLSSSVPGLEGRGRAAALIQG